MNVRRLGLAQLALLAVWILPVDLAADASLDATEAARDHERRGRYAEAENLFTRALVHANRERGAESIAAAIALSNLGGYYRRQGRVGEATEALTQALAVAVKAVGGDDLRVAGILNNLAVALVAGGDYARAERAYAGAVRVIAAKRGDDHADTAVALNNIAGFYHRRGRYAEAERLFHKALAVKEKALGADHPAIAVTLSNLAAVNKARGRGDRAEALLRRVLAIREAGLGADHPLVADSLNDLGGLYFELGRHAEAEPHLRRALAIREGRPGAAEGVPLGRIVSNLGVVLHRLGRGAEAAPLVRRWLAIAERAYGPGHPNTALAHNNLGELARVAGDFAAAERHHRRALEIWSGALGADHPDVARSHWKLALVAGDRGEARAGLDHARRATEIHRARTVQPRRRPDDTVRERARARPVFLTHIELLHRAGADGARVGESFRIGQLAAGTATAQTVTRMAARLGAGSDELARLVRRRQDGADRWAALDAALAAELARPVDRRRAEVEARIRAEMTALAASMEDLDARLAQAYPAYAELIGFRPVDLAAIQGLLAADEAMLVYLVHDGGAYLWLVRRDRARLVPLDLDRARLAEDIAVLREGLDPAGAATAADLPEYDFDLAHALYRALLAPVADDLAGIAHVMVVPSGGLESLPFAALTDKPYRPAEESLAVYRAAPWLPRRFAVSVLPAPSALWALRTLAKGSLAPDPLLGFGDPLLTGGAGTTRGGDLGALYGDTGLADVETVRALARLPETAAELRALARGLGAGDQAVVLGKEATERRVKESALDRARVLAFATHGLMAGELRGLAEPALVLTPPSKATHMDDGLLTAGEIAALRLNADWVILSACNTAAGDGRPGAEGFSGLTKAFFHAGARRLLVSHWPVASEAAAALTTALFARAGSGPVGAEAFRRAMLTVMADPARPHFAHPAMWAPFVVVGEGR